MIISQKIFLYRSVLIESINELIKPCLDATILSTGSWLLGVSAGVAGAVVIGGITRYFELCLINYGFSLQKGYRE